MPARGKQCEHVQCFDLKSYLVLNKVKNSSSSRWKCPICGIDATAEDLLIDTYIFHIIKQLQKAKKYPQTQTIEFQADGSWKAHETRIEQEKLPLDKEQFKEQAEK